MAAVLLAVAGLAGLILNTFIAGRVIRGLGSGGLELEERLKRGTQLETEVDQKQQDALVELAGDVATLKQAVQQLAEANVQLKREIDGLANKPKP